MDQILKIATFIAAFFVIRSGARKMMFAKIYEKFCTFNTDDKRRYLIYELDQDLKKENTDPYAVDYMFERNERIVASIRKIYEMTNLQLNAEFCVQSKEFLSDYGVNSLKRHFFDISNRIKEVKLPSDMKQIGEARVERNEN